MNRTAHRHGAGLAVLLASAPLSPSEAADVSDRLTLGVGVFDAYDFDDAAAEIRAEFRSGNRFGDGSIGSWFRGLGPLVGLMVTSDGALFGYGGLFADLRIGERWSFQPSGGIGGYAEGGGKDLGGVFQFHLGAELAYTFDNEVRVGFYVTHISNADIHTSNPGTNSLLLTVALPLGRVF